jgi:lysyl-tRNA synthetase class 2
MNHWQPSATVERLRQRAAIIKQIRDFFASRNVLEVETPALSQGTITDVYLDALSTAHALPSSSGLTPLYLQTSPEFGMKRMLASGFPDIYQICKCFREDEIGRLHNPEFTMLEWYRLGFSMQSLIDEVSDLLKIVLNVNAQKAHIEQYTYQALFQQYLHINPLTTSLHEITQVCAEYGLGDYARALLQEHKQQKPAVQDQNMIKDALLQVLFSQQIEAFIGQKAPVCVTHFPASQASLAKLSDDGQTALRFEFYYRGIELANGFEELTDASVQQQRFEHDNQLRSALGKAERPIDQRFLAALKHGLPECSGLALGLDRLIMLALGCDDIGEVLSFDIQRS